MRRQRPLSGSVWRGMGRSTSLSTNSLTDEEIKIVEATATKRTT